MRLVTRADFDGVVCGALITAMEEIDSYLFVEPKFVQDGVVDYRPGDVVANLPYRPGLTLWFDHHFTNSDAWPRHIGVSSSGSRLPGSPPGAVETALPVIAPGKGGFRLAPSAARVVYEYYMEVSRGGPGVPSLESGNAKPENPDPRVAFLNSARMTYLLEETDRIDAGKLVPEDVLHPEGYVLVSMTLDGKRPEDEPYWLRLIALLRNASLEEILKEPEVERRCREILDAQERLKEILLERTKLIGNVIFLDLRGVKDIPDGNRFLLYTLFPAGNISIKVAEDSQRSETTAISVGYNIFNTTSKVNVGALMEKYGGGGHRVVGSCRVPDREAEKAVAEVLDAIRE